jgi:hypothetical protein
MNKYNNGKIYKITSPDTDDIYVGSTTQELQRRLYGHESDFKFFKKEGKRYVTSAKILKFDNYSIELIEDVDADSKEELLLRESYYVNSLPNVINKVEPHRTKAYHDTYQKNYRKEHKMKRRVKQNELLECHCGGKYTVSNKAKHFETSRHRNPRAAKDNSKLCKRKKLNECECGGKYLGSNKGVHCKTLTHRRHTLKMDLDEQIAISNQLSERFQRDKQIIQNLINKIDQLI